MLAGVRGEQRVDGLEAPLLGRDAELRLVKDLFHAAVDRLTPRLVVVSGPAGVGKSRLGWEFEKYVDGLVGQVWWHRGRCLSYGDGVVFWALAQIVRQRLGIAEEDSTDVAAGKLGEKLAEYLPDPVERSYVAVRLGRLLGVPVSTDSGGTLARSELFAGWRLFFERLAATAPVVLLIDDLQYADAGLLEFLDHLIDWARDVPIFVLVFTRPELEHTRPGWAAGRNRTGLTLDPLDPRSMDDLVEALVPGMPAAARRMIIGQAQGIPLFAVETIRSLIDRDIVVPREGAYRLVSDVGTLTVPDGLHALLAARLDALDPDLRVLVADAAVLGSSFPAEALIAVSGRDEATVRAGLTELLRREVLEVSADKLSPERGSYRFAQNLLGQVAYETLSRRDRKARHLAVAAHLRATFAGDGDEVIDAVAQHYQDALRAVPDDPTSSRFGRRRSPRWSAARSGGCVPARRGVRRPTTPPPPPCSTNRGGPLRNIKATRQRPARSLRRQTPRRPGRRPLRRTCWPATTWRRWAMPNGQPPATPRPAGCGTRPALRRLPGGRSQRRGARPKLMTGCPRPFRCCARNRMATPYGFWPSWAASRP